MYRRPHKVWLLLIILTVLVITPAMATPIFFTDRAAFNTTVGDYRLLTLDAPNQLTDFGPGLIEATYGDLITFSFDHVSGYGVEPGFVVIGHSGQETFARGLEPVIAFGLDITPLDPVPCLDPCPGPYTPFHLAGVEFILTQPQFLGVLFEAPTNIEFSNAYFSLAGYGEDVSSYYAVDNLSFKTVPEPSSLWLLGVGLVGLVAWRWKRAA